MHCRSGVLHLAMTGVEMRFAASHLLQMKERKSIILSDESIVNSYGIRVMTRGIQLARFKKNPIMLFMHDAYKLPVGKWNNVRYEGSLLLGDPEFDEGDAFAMELKRKWEAGYLSGASVRISPLTLSDEAKNLLPGQSRMTITKSELKEASLVTLPSNANCVTLSADGKAVEVPTIKNNFAMTTEARSALIKTLNLSDDATDDQINAAVKTLTDTRVDVALAAGRAKGVVTDANEKHMRSFATGNLVAFNDMVKDAPELEKKVEDKPADQTLGDLIKNEGKQIPAADPKNKDRKDWSFADFQHKDPKALLDIKLNDPKRYDELVSAYTEEAFAQS